MLSSVMRRGVCVYNLGMEKSASLMDFVGNTPLVRLCRMERGRNNTIFAKLEGNNPASSVKDRPVANMIRCAAARGDISPGDRLVEATSGNTGIALAMVAAALGYRMTLIMPANQTEERKQTMRAYGAELILVSKEEGMEGARDMALAMAAKGEAFILNQFANPDNPAAHYKSTAPEIWRDTDGALRTLFPAWGRPARLWVAHSFSKRKIPPCKLSACNRRRAHKFPAFANGRMNICQSFSATKK